jgi:hypothetical protein
LYVLLKLRDDTKEEDLRIVNSLRNAGWFTHVAIVVLSWPERPDAVRNPIVRRAVDLCREKGIGVIWGRWLWVAWPGTAVVRATPNDQIDPAFYAAALATIKSEARALGADGAMLDCEPYGKGPQSENLEHRELTDEDRRRISAAVALAVSRSGQVDLIYPSSSARSTHFSWPLTDLGVLRLDAKSYYTKPDGIDFPTVRPPGGYVHRLDLWGCNVGLGRSADHHKGQSKLTIKEARTLDPASIRRRFPDCRGIWVYVDYDMMAEVLERWNEGS